MLSLLLVGVIVAVPLLGLFMATVAISGCAICDGDSHYLSAAIILGATGGLTALGVFGLKLLYRSPPYNRK